MTLVVGLGNPGREYAQTKHNVGFLTVDELGKRVEIELSKKKFRGSYGEGFWTNERLLLLKPDTYMNRSGEAVLGVQRFYNIPDENIIVAHDEMDLQVGAIKIRRGGGSAGHNGVKSIISGLGTQNFVRVRLGIGKPASRSEGPNHVLSKFGKREWEIMEGTIKIAADAVLEIIKEGLENAMNKFNTKSRNQELTI